MNHRHLAACMMACCVMMLPQIGTAQTQPPSGTAQPYEPAVPAAPTVNAYGAYPGTYGASTAAGSALNGMANAISAKGNYNLSTSAAASNMTQAQSNEIQNHQQYEDTYFQMRQANDAYREKEAGPRPTEEQLARLARESAPQPVSPSEVNSVSGAINWPGVLQEDSYAADRTTLEQLSAKKASQGSLSVPDEMTARKTIESMFGEMKSQIQDVPPQDYMASRNFLRSMIYSLAHSQLN